MDNANNIHTIRIGSLITKLLVYAKAKLSEHGRKNGKSAYGQVGFGKHDDTIDYLSLLES